jgi:hypothetical protein
METKYEMMIAAYGMYMTKEKELNFSTKSDYKGRAEDYYLGNTDEKPPHLAEAEEVIGFNTSD